MVHNSSSLLESCTLCPRSCGINRLTDAGFCSGSSTASVNLHQLHFWEEPVLSGTRGSGTIFFANCTMRCVYCQNFRLSHEGHGINRSTDELSSMMLDLQAQHAHNVNLVTASHYTLQAAEAIAMARSRGLDIPVVWNSNAYEKPETLRLLDGLVDIYLPDFRYYDQNEAEKYSNTPNYPEWAKKAIMEMYRQTGHLVTKYGIAKKGIMIRLLVLPGQNGAVRNILSWIAESIGTETYVSLMGQYYPAYRSKEFPEINRFITDKEYDQCLGYLDEFGFENGFIQEAGSSADFTPDFKV